MAGIFDHIFGFGAPPATPAVDPTPAPNSTPQAAGSPEVDTPIKGLWRAVWIAKRIPDPGTGNYAWSTLQLPLKPNIPVGPLLGQAQSPARPSSVFRLFRGTETPLFPNQQVVVNGIPLTAGQIALNPLFDPAAPGTGYTAQSPVLENFGYSAGV